MHSNPSQIELEIIETILINVYDPEIEIDIVNLGLVYDVKFNGYNQVTVTMTLSTPSCPLGDSIVQDVKESIKRSYPDFEVAVNLVFEPQWHQGMITPEGKEMLGMI
ncbi:MAG: metal-sulfur cluster assembly factor [Flavobacteriaceae bacterium]|jgi:metal-sulfur cluster biosynthetic enzyme|nr:metal-sulfur cluster assembly factor [Flavobacteriaceae bacterium]